MMGTGLDVDADGVPSAKSGVDILGARYWHASEAYEEPVQQQIDWQALFLDPASFQLSASSLQPDEDDRD